MMSCTLESGLAVPLTLAIIVCLYYMMSTKMDRLSKNILRYYTDK